MPDVTLLMRFADCVPILLYDHRNEAIGLAHAGWVGTVRRAAQAAVDGMITTFGSDAAEIMVCLGPSIGPDHYEIGADVATKVREAFGEQADQYLHSRSGSIYFDLWAANRDQLVGSGVQHLEMAEICTACHTEDWFSHRAEKGSTGRFGALIGLE